MKVIKLRESDIKRIVKKVITENYGYDEYIPNIQLGDTFRDTFNGDIFRVTDIQQNNPDGEGEDYETWVELENKGGEVVSFPHHYERGVRFNDVFTKVYLKPKYNYPPLDDIQLNEQEKRMMDKRVLTENRGMDFYLEELAEFANNLEYGNVYVSPIYTLDDDEELRDYDVYQVELIIQQASDDESLTDNEWSAISEYGQDIIKELTRKG